MREAASVEAFPYRPHPAVHHIGWGNDIRACTCLGEPGPGEELERLIVVHLAVPYSPAVTMARIFAEAEVGHDQHIVREPLLYLALWPFE